jgi:hypothetical protein
MGILSAQMAHLWFTGGVGAREELRKLRTERWKKLPEHCQTDKYSGGDHLTWLEAYRKARDEHRKDDWRRSDVELSGA